MRDDEDKGLHYLPQYYINKIITPTQANLVITIMHHSPDWYIDKQKQNIEEAILGKSSLIFYGHEHYLGVKSISLNKEKSTIINSGGALCNGCDWINSEFNICSLDTTKMQYRISEFKWNQREKQYENNEADLVLNLPKKNSTEKKLIATVNYINEFL